MESNPAQPLRIDLDNCKNLTCPICEKKGIVVKRFISITELKIIPRTMSPTGNKLYLPVTSYKCGKCKSLIKDQEKNLPITTIGK